MRISDWSSDVCSSDLLDDARDLFGPGSDLIGRSGDLVGGERLLVDRLSNHAGCIFDLTNDPGDMRERGGGKIGRAVDLVQPAADAGRHPPALPSQSLHFSVNASKSASGTASPPGLHGGLEPKPVRRG